MKSFLLLYLISISLCYYTTYDTSKDGNYKYYNEYLCSHDLIGKMGIGWNLGNSLECASEGKTNEGLSSETIGEINMLLGT